MTAHKNDHCLVAANTGIASAQYSVALGYQFEGDLENAARYYELAADNGAVAAYLALAHILREHDKDRTITWYQLYVFKTRYAEDNGGAGYAALLLAQIYKEKNNAERVRYWLDVCKQTSYSENFDL